MHRFQRRSSSYLLILLLAFVSLAQAKTQADVHTETDKVTPQVYRTYSFNDGDIEFSNKFYSGRVNRVTQQSDDAFTVVIEPENTPINNSAWYAFNVQAKRQTKIVIRFRYRDGQHRYHPKISRDARLWTPATAKQYRVSKSGKARLMIEVGPEKLWVAAQELSYSAQALQGWLKSYEQKDFASLRTIGESVEGRPIELLELGSAEAKNSVILIGRQHPAEVTGTIAQLAFVRRIADDSALSKAFRQHFKALVILLMNPDGVINGHWRHNVNGVDLNRDWYTLQQPEVQSAAKVFREEVEKPGQKVWFALDFHSTRKDVFYSIKRHLTGSDYQLIDDWLGKIKQKFPDYPAKDKPGSLERGVAKNWFYRDLGVPAITYEVGDETPRPAIVAIGDYAATAMMELLLYRVGVETQALNLENVTAQ